MNKLKEQEYYKNPKICLNCNNVLPFHKRKNKFCSKSCSATFNNKIRVRHSWSNEQKIKFSNKQIRDVEKTKSKYIHHKCKYCGNIINTTGTKTCTECKQYVGYLRTFKKFKLLEKSLKYRYDTVKQIIQDEYFNKKESLVTISKKYNLDITTTYRFVLDNEFKCRSKSDSLRLAFNQGRIKLNLDNTDTFITGCHKSWDNKYYKYRSSWEDKYMSILDTQKIKYIYEPFCLEYYDTSKGKKRYAIPDFYLPETNEIVELKSSYTFKNRIQEMKDKFKEYKNKGYIPKLLLDWKFVNIDEYI